MPVLYALAATTRPSRGCASSCRAGLRRRVHAEALGLLRESPAMARATAPAEPPTSTRPARPPGSHAGRSEVRDALVGPHRLRAGAHRLSPRLPRWSMVRPIAGGVGPWRSDTRSSSSAAGRSAWRSPSSSGCAASPARWWRSATALGSIPKGQNLTQRTLEHFYFWGIVRRAARGALAAAGLRDRRDHRLRQSDGRVLVRAAGPRARAPYYFQTNDRLPQYQMEKVLRAQDGGRCPTSRAASAGRRRQSSRTPAARASPSTKDGADARCWRPTTWSAATAATPSCASRSASRAAAPTSTSSWCWSCSARASCTRGSSASRRARPIAPCIPDLNGYWQFFGRIDVGEGFFFHAPVPPDTTRGQFRFPRPAAEAAGFDVRLRVRPCRLLGPARRGRRDTTRSGASSSPATPRTAIRPMAASASTTGWRTRPISAGSSRRGSTAGAATRCCSPTAKSGGRSSRRSAEDFIAARIRDDGAFLDRYSPERDRAEFERGLEGRQSDVGNGAQVLRAALRGLAGGDRPAGRRLQRPRQARVQGARRASPAAAAAVVRPQRVRGAGRAASRCWRSMPTTPRSRRSSRRRGR